MGLTIYEMETLLKILDGKEIRDKELHARDRIAHKLRKTVYYLHDIDETGPKSGEL